MADKLVIVESPAKAKTIGKFLGKNYKVIASNGHVRDLPKSQFGVDVDDGFKPKYITMRGRGDVLERIKKEAKGAKTIYLATDPDREGEAISWHIANVLKLDPAASNRIVFNEITASVVKNSVKSPRPIDMSLVDAQQARRILDRIMGYKLSPLLWAKVRKGLSAGRVQSVATRIIVDREQEIRDFVPEEYWTLIALLTPKGAKKPFEAKFYGIDGKKLEPKNEAQIKDIIAKLKGVDYIASDVKKSVKKRHAPAPFTTSNLQQEAARKLGFTTKRTMMVAQMLYEGIDIPGQGSTGLVTYIRTDSVRVSKEAQTQALEYIAQHYGKRYAPNPPNFYKGRKGAQDAHESIRPTSVTLRPQDIKGSLTNDQFKLYKLIYERFIASQMAEAEYDVMSVTIAAGDCTFKATGSVRLFDGYMAVYTEGRDDGKSESDELGSELPAIAQGDKFACGKLEPEQHFTQPPLRYTEASLVRALEEKGIGRPSTYSPTIITITDRGYVRREAKHFVPTELGEIVTKLMKEHFKDIVDVEFTANMEKQLDEIEEANLTMQYVLEKFYTPFKDTLATAEKTIEKVKIADEVSDIQCEKCGRMMVYKLGRFGRFLACPGFPECRNAKPILETIETPCPKCGAKLIKRKSKKGTSFYGCEKYPDCDFISWDMPISTPCPKCGAYMVQKPGKVNVCSNKECENSKYHSPYKKTAAKSKGKSKK